MVTQVDLDRCSNFIEKVRLERFNQVRTRQVRKFHILCSKNGNKQANSRDRDNRIPIGVYTDSTDSNNQVVRHGNDKQTGNSNLDSKWVINLSKTELTEAQKSVLSKGPILRPDEELRELENLSLTIKSMFCEREKVPVSKNTLIVTFLHFFTHRFKYSRSLIIY